MKKRVGVVLHNDLSIDVRVLNELKILKKKYETHVLCAAEKIQHPEKIAEFDYEVISTKSSWYKFMSISNTTNRLFHSFWENKIVRFLAEKRIDLLHVHDLYMLPPAIEACQKSNTPLIIDLHENYEAAFRTYSWTKNFPHRLFVDYNHWKHVEKKYLPKADGIVVLSDHYKKTLQAEYPMLEEKPFAIYPNVPDMDFFKAQKSEDNTSDSILRLFYFGMIGKSRGLHIASDGVRQLREKGYKVELHVAGKVHKNDRQYFEEKVMADYVKYTPWIPLEDLGAHVSKMDVCISPILKNPQHESGIANKVFQYMYFAKPILVSDCAPQESLAEEEHCGLSHKDDDPSDFAAKVEWLIKNPSERKQMGIAGRRAVLQNYNTSKMGERLIDLYQEVQKNNS